MTARRKRGNGSKATLEDVAGKNRKATRDALLGHELVLASGEVVLVREWSLETGTKISAQLLELIEMQQTLGAAEAGLDIMLTNALSGLRRMVCATCGWDEDELDARVTYRDFLKLVGMIQAICLQSPEEDADGGPLGDLWILLATWVNPFRLTVATSPERSASSSDTDTDTPTS